MNRSTRHRHLIRAVLAATALAFSSVARAQVVMGSPRILGTTPPAQENLSRSGGRPGALSTINSMLAKPGPIAQWGPLAFRPHFSYSFLYGNGLLRVPGEPVNSSRHSVTLGLLTELGSSWSLDAATTRSIYSSRLLVDSFDNSASLEGKRTFGDWTFGLSSAYASNSPIVVETGGQNDEETTRTAVDVSYKVSDRTFIDLTAAWSLRLADPKLQQATWTGSNWEQISITTWINYQFSEKFGASLGLLAGEDRLDKGDDMSYTQPQARINWRPTDRVSIMASTGIEIRKVDAPGGGTTENPVYSLNMSYSPTMTTTVSVGGSRNISTSYFNNQTIESTQYSASISQRLIQRLFLTVSGSLGSSKYAGTTVFFLTNRDDDYESISTSISTSFFRRGKASISYTSSRNSSNATTFGYSSQQMGAELSYRF